MDQDEVFNRLKSIFFEAKRSKTVLVRGKWGIGKSYAWRRLLENNFSSIEDKKKKIFLNISVFGHESLESIREEIRHSYIKAYTQSFSKHSKWIQNKIPVDYNNILKLIFKGRDLTSAFRPPLDINTIVCFDDLERKSKGLSLQDLLGLIENTSLSANVLLFLNDSKLDADDKKIYLEYREKIIDYDYELNSITDSIIDSIAKENAPSANIDQINVARNIFLQYGNLNLRSWVRILESIEILIQDHDIRPEIIPLVSAIALEYAMGNKGFSKSKNPQDKSAPDNWSKYGLNPTMRTEAAQIESFVYNGKVPDFDLLITAPKSFKTPRGLILIRSLELVFFGTKNQAIQILRESLSTLNQTNPEDFGRPDTLLQLSWYCLSHNEKYSLGFSEWSFIYFTYRTFLKFDFGNGEYLELYLSHLEHYNDSYYSKASNIHAAFNRRLRRELRRLLIPEFYSFYERQNFSACLRILEMDESIIAEVVDLLDDILKPISQTQFQFMKTLYRRGHRIFQAQFSAKLQNLELDASSDKVIENKLRALINPM